MRAKQVGIAVTLTIGFAAGVAHAEQAPVTFSKDVAPIFYNHCVECHRPTMFAPMSLLTYEDARPWARAIKQRVLSREMPPWGADPAIGHFRNDSRLSQSDIDMIVAWVDGGAQKGNDADLPSPSCRDKVDVMADRSPNSSEHVAINPTHLASKLMFGQMLSPSLQRFLQ
jgi:mono/diheme cytochrome c family protein